MTHVPRAADAPAVRPSHPAGHAHTSARAACCLDPIGAGGLSKDIAPGQAAHRAQELEPWRTHEAAFGLISPKNWIAGRGRVPSVMGQKETITLTCVIPTRADHHALAQSRRPMDMMIQGW